MSTPRLSGQGVVEYSLVQLLVTLLCAAALEVFGLSIVGFFSGLSL
jgi:hypothetical protein